MYFLDSLPAIASFVDSRLNAGDAIYIAGEVIQAALGTETKKADALGDTLLNALCCEKCWAYTYDNTFDLYCFACLKAFKESRRLKQN